MKLIKPYLKSALVIFLILVIGSIISATLYYFNISNKIVYTILNLIIVIISFLFGGIHIGKQAKEKGYLEGIKLAVPFLVIFLLVTLILKQPLTVVSAIYYLIILFITTLGSVIGINKKA